MESNHLSTILLRIAVHDETVMGELDEMRLVERLRSPRSRAAPASTAVGGCVGSRDPL
jgi:hypothetical protein